MKYFIIALLAFSGCADDSNSTNQEAPVIINHGYLNKNIVSIESFLYDKVYVKDLKDLKANIEIDLFNLRLKSSMHEYGQNGEYCQIDIPLSAQDYIDLKKTISRIQVCEYKSSSTTICEMATFVPFSRFSLYSQSGYELEVSSFKYSVCTAAGKFVCDYMSGLELDEKIDALINLNLNNCN